MNKIEIKSISNGVVIGDKVYYKIWNKSLLEDDCSKCDLKNLCSENYEVKSVCSVMYTNGYFKKKEPNDINNHAVINKVELNVNNRFFEVKWDPRYEGCKSCIFYRLYVDPEVTGFNEDIGRKSICNLHIGIRDNNNPILVKDFCNPDDHEVYQFKTEFRI